jgi:penicillin amidase
MKRFLKFLLIALVILLTLTVIVAGAGYWHARSKLPQRSGLQSLQRLEAPVKVVFDERGVPHISAGSEADLYRALGYLHAQDRLFQMELLRRLARGELAQILGPALLDTDKLFRILGLREHAEAEAAKLDPQSKPTQVLLAYLDGINQFQDTHSRPLEFELLGITARPFTPADTMAVSGYLAYSFSAALRTEPALTFVRDQLGADYLKTFDLDWNPQGVIGPLARQIEDAKLSKQDWQSLTRLASLSQQAVALGGLPEFEGSNAWVISGRRTVSGKPLLAGDPHIGFATPAVWYEAHLSSPGFEIYGHYQALNPLAMLGHNRKFGWTLTMFQNDDMDLVAEKINPANRNQVAYQGQWTDIQVRQEVIQIKGAAPVQLTVRRTPHGPVINDVFADSLPKTPIALWWAFLETDNPILEAFYELGQADTRDKARQAASKIHAPGLNILWANATGDIGWWAAAKLPQRPAGVNPNFILDGSSEESNKPGFYRFADNPQEENPARGFIVSANHQPLPNSGVPVPGYYNSPARAQRLTQLLDNPNLAWNLQNSQALQLDELTTYGPHLLKPLIPILRTNVIDPVQRTLIDALAEWDGRHNIESVTPTVFNQFVYELAKAAMADELGEVQFKNLLRTRTIDSALLRLTAQADSPWWDNLGTAAVESRTDTVLVAWRATIAHLERTFGKSLASWTWGQAHTVTHNHLLAQRKPLGLLFSVGPFPAPGGHEIPNNFAHLIGPAPWTATYGPSTRRLIDFADPTQALGINPVGQSGVLFDPHYADQARTYIQGGYLPMHLSPADVASHSRSTLMLQPAP